MHDPIRIRNARVHNLRGVDVDLPRDALTVVTGLSGSGKSSLAFDTLYQEGQRRFMESLSPYARQFLGQMERPAVDRIEGLSPTLSVDQKTVNRNTRSTVGTVTELYDHLRLLWARLGTPRCPTCHTPIARRSPGDVADQILREGEGKRLHLMAPVVRGRKGEYRQEMSDWLRAGWLRARIDGKVVSLEEPPELGRYENHTLEIVVDRVVASHAERGRIIEGIERALGLADGLVSVLVGEDYTLHAIARACPTHGTSIPEVEPRLFSFNAPQGACGTCGGIGQVVKVGKRIVPAPWDAADPQTCPGCEGRRLNPIALAVTFRDLTIDVATAMSVEDAHTFFQGVDLDATELLLGEGILKEIRERLAFLHQVGLGYLALDRRARTLSGGEAQRIRLASCVGSGLQGVTYVLDEPSIGLHPRDNRRMLDALLALRDNGNTMIVVEHDRETMELADRIVDIGPGAGIHGGRLVAEGAPADFVRTDAPTARWLRGEEVIPLPASRRTGNGKLLRVRGASARNLKSVDLDLPLGTLTVFTGVSGSGKSTLVFDILRDGLEKVLARGNGQDLGAEGARPLRNASPLAAPPTRSARPGPRSSPASVSADEAAGGSLHRSDPLAPLSSTDRVAQTLRAAGTRKGAAKVPPQASAVPVTTTPPESVPVLSGTEHVQKVIEIDQQPIGRTPRSNPATYSGAFDIIRDLFAGTPEARARGYAKGHFSFNVPGGRCESCEGAGVRTIAMQFLADVDIPCETCEGARFTRETLDVRWKEKSIADILGMPINEAVPFFSAHTKLHRILSTMERVGLGYVTLGQPATTLSGGEAQRLKLATELHRPPASAGRGKPTDHTLYLLDEPTTGLHFADVRVLIGALQDLVDAGHSVVVIEHNTDLVKVADHVIELGPEGGAAGGYVLAVGTPEDIARTDTATGRVLAALPDFGGRPPSFSDAVADAPARAPRVHDIVLTGARCHNLKGVDVTFPRGKLTVVTGPSGSGKTSLAFDTLFAEGQRRYVECLSTYARRFLGRMERAPLDSAKGLAPSIAIDQKTVGHNPRSTVATTTELHDHFRLLWANLGVPHCPKCGEEARALPPSLAAGHLARSGAGRGRLLTKVPKGTTGASLRAEGFARAWVRGKEVDLDGLDTVSELVVDRFDPATAEPERVVEAVTQAYRRGGGKARFVGEARELPLAVEASCPKHGKVLAEALTPRQFSFNHWSGACRGCGGLGRVITVTGGARAVGRMAGRIATTVQEPVDDVATGTLVTCPACNGGRLRPELLAVTFAGKGMADVARMTVDDAHAWFEAVALAPIEARIAEQPLREVRARLGFLVDVGLGYLALGRTADTLSGGEAQRIRLASQLGGGLSGVIYVLDEPTIGLHPRDTARLLDTLEKLRALGNTLVVVEHDPDTMRRADHLIDMGPGAGEHGGRIMAAGRPDALGPDSPTGAYLTGARSIPVPARRRPGNAPITIRNATRHSLQHVDVDLPTGALVAITGVSGSGKSTLILDLLAGALAGKPVPATITLPSPDMAHEIVNQAPIGRSPRSTPATYVGVLDPIRALFAATTTAQERGWGVGRFSYNTKDGACKVCGGYGSEQVEMHFLSNVWIRCEACRGRRFSPETLEVRWKGLNIADVLDLRVDEAVAHFSAHRRIVRPLQALVDVGLGYLKLGQPGTELSGGEAQRVKLACGLGGSKKARCIYVLDEPTTGLHLSDIEKLVAVFDRLVEEGHTVLVVEHHLDVIQHADWIIDMGPEPGAGGGRIVATGTPEQVARVQESWTGQALARK